MEMPDGWRRYNRICLLSELPDSLKAVSLLKEMAEALEAFQEFGMDFNRKDFDKAKEVLKKFKEWK